MDEANHFLHETFIPFWRRRFTVAPAEDQDAYRPIPPETDLNSLFAESDTRVLWSDFSFRHHKQVWHIESAEATDLRPKQRVTIEGRLDDSVHYHCAGKYTKPVPFTDPLWKLPRATQASSGTPAAPTRARHSRRKPVIPVRSNPLEPRL